MSKWVIRVFIFCLCLRLWKRNCLQFCCVNRTIQYNSRQWFTTWTHHSFDPSSARRVALLTRGLFLNSPSLSIHIHIFFVYICILVCPCFHCYVRMVFWLLFFILGLISLKVLINGLLFVLHVDSLLEK